MDSIIKLATTEPEVLEIEGVLHPDFLVYIEVEVNVYHKKTNKPVFVLESEDIVEKFSSMHELKTYFIKNNYDTNTIQ